MTEYQGHKDRGHWNVALWLGNDELSYRAAMEVIESHGATDAGARALMAMLPTSTPDRFEYTRERVLAALKGLDE